MRSRIALGVAAVLVLALGIVVDGVSDVLRLETDQVHAVPDLGSAMLLLLMPSAMAFLDCQLRCRMGPMVSILPVRTASFMSKADCLTACIASMDDWSPASTFLLWVAMMLLLSRLVLV